MSQVAPIDKKQKLLVEHLLADAETFVKCIRIATPSYFEPPLDRVVEYITSHFNTHHSTPTVDIIEAETGVLLKERELDSGGRSYFLEEFEKHCKNAAMVDAIMKAADYISEGNLSPIQDLIRDAQMIRLDNHVGIDMFDGVRERVEQSDVDMDERPIGIKALDDMIGNIRRRELGMIFGGTAGGKSVQLANFADRLAHQQLDVYVITIELAEELYAKRLDAIISGINIKKHALEVDKIVDYAEENRDNLGRIVVKKAPYGTTANTIRTYVMEYHLKYGKYPDALLVDYLALMGIDKTNKFIGNKSDEDEVKAFGLREIGVDYDMYVFSAGQITRDAYDTTQLGPNHIAGGISVINASDWAVGLVATEEDIDNNQVQAVQMKVRNSEKHTKPVVLYRCPHTLQVRDAPMLGQNGTKVSTPVDKLTKKPQTKQKEVAKAPASLPSNESAKSKLRAVLGRV